MMGTRRSLALLLAFALLVLGGCATRPVNLPLATADNDAGYRYLTRERYLKDKEDLVVLAFSGGGTRAAAFSYGVLEALRTIPAVDANGARVRLLADVDVISAVSGGSFTALAYGLYGERLFDDYEQRFLKRNVQGELVARALNPFNWGALSSTGWGRSELAAQLYDEILFGGATFADLERGRGPLISVSATDLSTGARVYFLQSMFDAFCSDLSSVPLSRAAAASSAVPLVLSPVTFNNYGNTCHYSPPPGMKLLTTPGNPGEPAARAMQRLNQYKSYQEDPRRPYVHLIDGAFSDNLGMRGMLEILDDLEALQALRQKTPIDHVRRVVVYVVNSLSTPDTHWDESETPPGSVAILLKAAGVPIDYYSFEAVAIVKDIAARWARLRAIRDSTPAIASENPALAEALKAPDIDIYVIDVSFPALEDKAEVEYLNSLPTSFVLPAEAIDRLRAAAGKIILASPEFGRMLKARGLRLAVVDR